MHRRSVPFAELWSFAQFSATGASSGQPRAPCERPASGPRRESHDLEDSRGGQHPITLFEAVADLDACFIYLQQKIALQGQELAEEWRILLAQATSDLCLAWFDRHREVVKAAQPQCGDVSYYPRRRPADSRLDPELSLSEQFNLLRVVDNQGYPAFFHWRGRRYILNFQSDCADVGLRNSKRIVMMNELIALFSL